MMFNGFEVQPKDGVLHVSQCRNRALDHYMSKGDWGSTDDAYWNRFWEVHYHIYLREAGKAMDAYYKQGA